jgi:hypothetical protein
VQAISKLYTKLLSIDHTIDPNKEVLVTDGAYEALFTGDLFLKLSLFFAVFQCGSGSCFLPQYGSRSGSGSKPMRIHSYPDPGQTLPPEKVGF